MQFFLLQIQYNETSSMSESDTPEQSKYIRHRQTWKPLHYMEIVVFCFKQSRKNSYHSALLLLKFWNFLNIFAQKKFVQQKKNMNWNGTFTNRSQPVCCLLSFSLPILQYIHYTVYSYLRPQEASFLVLHRDLIGSRCNLFVSRNRFEFRLWCTQNLASGLCARRLDTEKKTARLPDLTYRLSGQFDKEKNSAK